jgi:hypothetical protein
MLYISRVVRTTRILDSVPSRILSVSFETSTLVPCIRNDGKQGSVACCYQGRIYICGIPGRVKMWRPLSRTVKLCHDSHFLFLFVIVNRNKK